MGSNLIHGVIWAVIIIVAIRAVIWIWPTLVALVIGAAWLISYVCAGLVIVWLLALFGNLMSLLLDDRKKE